MLLALVFGALLLAGSSDAERVPLTCDPQIGGSSAGGMADLFLFGFNADSFTACLPGPYWDGIAGAYGMDDWSYLYELAFTSDGTSITAETELGLQLPGAVYAYLAVNGVATGTFVAPPGPRAYQRLVLELERTGFVSDWALGVSLRGPPGSFGTVPNLADLPDGVSEIPLDPLEPDETYFLHVSGGATLEEAGAGTARLVAAVDIPEPGPVPMFAIGALVLAIRLRSRRGPATW